MNIYFADAILNAVPEEGCEYSEVINAVSSSLSEDEEYVINELRRLSFFRVLVIEENWLVTRGPRYDECLAELTAIQASMKAFSAKYG